MALTLDAITNTTEQLTTSGYSWTHTTSGSERLLIVGVVETVQQVTGITYNGISLTKAGAQTNAFRNLHSEVWYLFNPALGANTVSVTFAGSNAASIGGSISFNGAEQSTKVFDSTGGLSVFSGTSDSFNLTTTLPNEFIVDVLSIDPTSTAQTPSGSQTQAWFVIGTTIAGGMSYQGPLSSGTKTDGWTWTTSSFATLAAASFSPVILSKIVPRNNLRPRLFAPGNAR